VIIFHNPGLMPIDAIRLMGASVKTPGAFGRFGTGFKYALATILRGGGDVHIWRGAEELGFSLRGALIKEQAFEEVVLTRKTRRTGVGAARWEETPLGFTTQLGKDWEPWMALRELACNARDEGGDFKVVEAQEVPSCFSAKDGETVIVVKWPELDRAAKDGELHVFAEGELLHEEAGVRVLAGPSEYLYHRGVRVWKLPKPSVFTYDIVSPVELTEDRGVKYAFCVVADVRNMLLATADRSLIAATVTAGKERWEGAFDWSGQEWMATDPGQEWLEEVATLRAGHGANLSKSAVDVYLSHTAFKTETRYGGSYEEPVGTFGDVMSLFEDLGINLTTVNFFVTDELPGGAFSAVRGGSVYVTRNFLETASRLGMATELLMRFLEVHSGGDFDALLTFVVPTLLYQNHELRSEKEIMEAREAGLRQTPVEAFLGLHPVLSPPDVPAEVADF
jgi:hypothetical protein